ncbi:MAG: hypothetical protein AB8B57_14970 [Congregibacter sp.]
MQSRKSFFVGTKASAWIACLACLCAPVQALTLSSVELQAASQLGCVLADDALGYLDEEQFNQRFDDVVQEFSDDAVDVIYAKALGYIDGLLFGVPSGESVLAAQRLEAYSNSGSCSRMQAVRHTVSL